MTLHSRTTYDPWCQSAYILSIKDKILSRKMFKESKMQYFICSPAGSCWEVFPSTETRHCIDSTLKYKISVALSEFSLTRKLVAMHQTALTQEIKTSFGAYLISKPANFLCLLMLDLFNYSCKWQQLGACYLDSRCELGTQALIKSWSPVLFKNHMKTQWNSFQWNVLGFITLKNKPNTSILLIPPTPRPP